MAHAKSRVSSQRRRKRRTHHKLEIPQISVCKTTGEAHIYHRAYEHEGALYYRGKVLVPSKDTAETSEVTE
ncbi:MAG TPA: 50S ribosomal protein L32 [Saprospiraceae bacterium]|nr:50S ribosomal protein L32 [Saprospiraceae bacterium]